MATSKLLRTPPPKNLNNYVASIRRIFGDPETVPDAKFSAGGTYAVTFESSMLVGDADLGYSVSNPIGFDVTINGKTYGEFSVSGAGWMMLRDPDGATSGATWWHDVLDSTDPNANIYTNEYINSDFSYDHVVLAPWFDRTWVTSANLTQLKSGLYLTDITATVEENVIKGADSNVWPYDTIDHGVRYVNGYDSKKGRYLVVRWTNTEVQYNSRLKFEVVLFENGTIEYRYWPRNQYKRPISYPSYSNLYGTIGVFWSGPSNGSNKFRDFSTFLDYDPKRSLSELGGSEYSPYYSDTSNVFSNSQPYSLNVGSSNWPKNGAVITFSPPVNPGKFLPRKIISSIAATKSLVSIGGLFDDRRTVNFFSGSNVVVNMPSTLPSRLLGNTSDNVNIPLRQLLFTKGSLKVTGSMKVGVIDSHLETLEALDKLQEPSKKAFNESQRNYQETASTSDFYATGSALEIFGDGFTTPLKSKTQFYFSLPVNKSVIMPATTASFYYYNGNKKTWNLIDPDGYRIPERIYSEFDNVTYADTYNTDFSSIYRVVETSRGFDSVGRKLISGSNIINFNYDPLVSNASMEQFQTADAIGTFVNFDKNNSITSRRRSADPITNNYNKSVTDNSTFFPTSDQAFSFPIEQPFLLEKVVVDIPVYISGAWFNDLTTCVRPHAHVTGAVASDPMAFGRFLGPIDFGGPGITFALMCGRKGENSSYLDLIASGTITHINDAVADVILKKDPGMRYHSMRPTGFLSFSNPTHIISGTNNVFEGSVRLEMEASVAGGLTFARNDRSLLSASISNTDASGYQTSNRDKAKELLTTKSIVTSGEAVFNVFDRLVVQLSDYITRSPRVYVQQVSPLSRGSSKINFSGNSILGGNIASFNLEPVIKNPLYSGYATAAELPAKYTDQINSASFGFDAVSIYSTVDSRPSPYLILPGDKLSISMSKTRPAIHKAVDTGHGFAGFGARYETYILTGSHGTVMLNTGSINITVYGSYIQEGVEYHP